MRIPSGTTDQVIYFVAESDFDGSLLTGLSSFTVYRSRNGGAAAAFTTPTVTEVDSTNMAGVYKLLLDEDMTIDSGDDSQEMLFRITATGMVPVTRTVELYRRTVTSGATLATADVDAIKTRVELALPNAAADAAGGLAISDAGGLDLDAMNAQLQIGGTLYDTVVASDVAIQAILVDTGTDIPALVSASAIRSAVGLASANLDTQFANVGGGSAVSADVVSAKRTWIGDDYRASNIVEVKANFAGVLALKPDLNPGTTIASVDSVSITGAATVTATSLSVDRSKTKAHFTVPALTTTGTYTVVVTVTTIEGDVIPTTATLVVN